MPLAILHKKGLVLDGSNPALLIGYGAYGRSFEASYDPPSLAWIRARRGAGLRQRARQRRLRRPLAPRRFQNHQAQHMEGWRSLRALPDRHRYASPHTLGISGSSAGGIFAGRAVTAAPELFAAAILDVGVLDAVRAEKSANGATNTSELGTAKNPDEFRALLEISTPA